MSRFFDLDSAAATLPELGEILGALRDQRRELIELRDQALRLQAAGDTPESNPAAGETATHPTTRAAADLRVLRLRMQGLIDQMQAGVARIDALGITLRELETGLVDFPALVAGRQVWLCWRLGEPGIGWWHELDTGIAGRRALADLE